MYHQGGSQGTRYPLLMTVTLIRGLGSQVVPFPSYALDYEEEKVWRQREQS